MPVVMWIMRLTDPLSAALDVDLGSSDDQKHTVFYLARSPRQTDYWDKDTADETHCYDFLDFSWNLEERPDKSCKVREVSEVCV